MIEKKIAILLVEDNKLIREMEKKVLLSLGYTNVIEAEDGKKAITILDSQSAIGLVLSDIHMPVMGGIDLLKHIRQSDKLKKIPVVMVSAWGEKKVIAYALGIGANGFITKPFDAGELGQKLDEIFGYDEHEKPEAKEKSPDNSQDSLDKTAAPETGSSKTGSSKVKIRIGHLQITDHIIVGVLKDMIESRLVEPKYFEIETHCFPSWNKLVEAFESGSLDAACMLTPIAMDLFNYKVPLKTILLLHRNGSTFVRNSDGLYSKPYQDFFRKKNFLVPHMLSIHHMIAHRFFKGIGLKPGLKGSGPADIYFEVVAPVQMPHFLKNGKDNSGFMVAEPFGSLAISSGIAELQFLSSEVWPDHPCCIFAVNSNFTGAHTDAVYELTEMLIKAGKKVESDPVSASKTALKFIDPKGSLGLSESLLKEILTEPMGIKTGNLMPVLEEFEKIQVYMNDKMKLLSRINLEKFVDLRFAMASGHSS